MKDFFYITGIILVILPFFYLVSTTNQNIYSLALFILVLYPTLAALVNGAPFVPTPMTAVNRMIKAAGLKKGDRIYDIGCGDGRIVHLASKQYEISATGFELSPFVYMLAKIKQILWKSKAKIVFGNFKKHNLSEADVIFCYLLPETLAKLEPKLSRELKKGAKVISYAFPVSSWTEKTKIESDPKTRLAPIWIYEKA